MAGGTQALFGGNSHRSAGDVDLAGCVWLNLQKTRTAATSFSTYHSRQMRSCCRRSYISIVPEQSHGVLPARSLQAVISAAPVTAEKQKTDAMLESEVMVKSVQQ